MHRNNLDSDGFQLAFGAPWQLRSLAGQEHGRTIPAMQRSASISS